MDIQTIIDQTCLSLRITEKSASYNLGIDSKFVADSNETLNVYSPINNSLLGSVYIANDDNYNQVVSSVSLAFKTWREVPAPKRGELIRQIGDAFRAHKIELGTLVSLEMGKTIQEGLGEVQEIIDICDFAVGLSRQLYGLTMHSERPQHRMYEQYHPLGVVGIITAFNFPVAVWAWNAMLAVVCGNTTIWKPSEKTPLTAVACFNIIIPILAKNNIPKGVFSLILGDAKIGSLMAADLSLPLISATGSTLMGKKVGQVVGQRLGKALLELGGNNAIIVTSHAQMDLALRAIVFGAIGTCGQRCTSTRRLIVHEDVYNILKDKLLSIYGKVAVGNPLIPETHMGPLIDSAAVDVYQNTVEQIKKEGGKILFGGKTLNSLGANYVEPTIAEVNEQFEIIKKETFAPILYLIKYSGSVENAIEINNSVAQGLSSSIFTTNIKESEIFLSCVGSDCGIANVNIGTSGAEIGGAFGGEKETGGGRESGSDAWKVYMRRQTNTINFSSELPLSQGLNFDVN